MSWIDTACSRLPKAIISEFRWVYGNVILSDVIPESDGELFSSVAFSVPVHIVPLSPLADMLRSQIDFSLYERIIWPGTGALTVQMLLDLKGAGEQIEARRIGYKNPLVEVGDILAKDVRTLIIDDVICSGATVCAVQEKGSITDCDLACLVIQYPRTNRLKSFGKILAPLMIRSEQGKVPLNSLSTFLKRQDIAEDYARRFARDPEEFLEALALIKQEVTYYA